MNPQADPQEIRRAIEVLALGGGVVEVRALDVSVPHHRYPHVRSGYFTDWDALAEAAASVSPHAVGVYVTLNPVRPELIARCANKLSDGRGGNQTSDEDIIRRQWLLIDIDPVRPSGISAADKEHDLALMKAVDIDEYLQEHGWPHPVIADSGNGAHLLYRIELPNDEQTTRRVRDTLRTLAARFNNHEVTIDTSVFNAARIVRLYGTVARKGDSVENRPHRFSQLLEVPDPIGIVSVSQLEVLAASAESSSTEAAAGPAKAKGQCEFLPPGHRHATLVSLAGTMIRRGMGEEEILASLLVTNQQRCEPPLEEDRVRKLVRDVVKRYTGKDTKPAEDESPAPCDVEEDTSRIALTGVEPFPLDVLPGPARRLVVEGARSLGCPPDLIAVPLLATLGAAIGTSRGLEVKPGWCEWPIIWAAVVARPGDAKSSAQAFALAPLQAAQERFHEQFVSSLRRREAEQSEPKTAASGAKDKESLSKRTAKPQKEDTAKPSASKVARVAPRERQILSTDATVEALVLALRQNPRGLCYAQDELTSLTGNFDRYRRGVGSDRQFFSSAWGGHTVVVHRVTAGKLGRELDTIRVELPFLCIIGGIQPDMLGEILDARGREDGFAHRFLWSFPDATLFHYCAKGVSDEALQGFQELVDKLLHGFPLSLIPGVPSTGFTEEGDARWLAFMESHAAETNDEMLPDYLRGPWRKLVSYCARLALILHLSRYACGEAESVLVDEVSVENAVKLISYFKSHARRTYQHLHEEPANQRVTTLLEWIAARGGSASVRDVINAKVAGCRNKGDVLELFERLRRMGVGEISTQSGNRGGRATIRFGITAGDRC